MARTLLTVPKNARAGDVIEIRALIAHPMETGYRPGADGRLVARDLIRRFSCHFDGQLVFSAQLHAAISANPYLVFHMRAERSGTLRFRWEGDKEFAQTETVALVLA